MEGSHRQLGRWIDTPEYHSQLGLLRLHVYKNLRCLASRIFSIKQNQTKPKTATKTETKTNSPKTNQTNKQQQQQQQEKEKKIPKKQKNKAQRNWSDISSLLKETAICLLRGLEIHLLFMEGKKPLKFNSVQGLAK